MGQGEEAFFKEADGLYQMIKPKYYKPSPNAWSFRYKIIIFKIKKIISNTAQGGCEISFPGHFKEEFWQESFQVMLEVEDILSKVRGSNFLAVHPTAVCGPSEPGARENGM